jgi:sulfur transfer protein SufE
MNAQSLDDVHADYELLEADDRYRLLIDLGRALEPMPDALKTDASLVRGCSASVWLYPLAQRGRPAPFPRRQQCRDHQGHRRARPARRPGQEPGRDP